MKILIIVLAKEEQARIQMENCIHVQKRGDVDRILRLLVGFGASEEILIEAHPHIGTNKLPQIIQDIREKLLHMADKCF